MKSEPLKLGLTGGIGSGKTTVCRVFGILGIPVFSSDNEAKRIMDNDPGLRSELCMITGRDLYETGKLDRKLMASLIFGDKELLEKINHIVHPAVFNSFRVWAEDKTAPYIILEAAILFESGADKLVDRILSVTAPADERIKRVMMRSSLSADEVMQRIEAQMNDEERARLSDYVISNSENEMIIPAILRIHYEILQTAKNLKYVR